MEGCPRNTTRLDTQATAAAYCAPHIRPCAGLRGWTGHDSTPPTQNCPQTHKNSQPRTTSGTKRPPPPPATAPAPPQRHTTLPHSLPSLDPSASLILTLTIERAPGGGRRNGRYRHHRRHGGERDIAVRPLQPPREPGRGRRPTATAAEPAPAAEPAAEPTAEPTAAATPGHSRLVLLDADVPDLNKIQRQDNNAGKVHRATVREREGEGDIESTRAIHPGHRVHRGDVPMSGHQPRAYHTKTRTSHKN